MKMTTLDWTKQNKTILNLFVSKSFISFLYEIVTTGKPHTSYLSQWSVLMKLLLTTFDTVVDWTAVDVARTADADAEAWLKKKWKARV